MKKLIITFSIFFVMCLFSRLIFNYYVDTVPVFGVLLTPLMWLTVAFGALAIVLTVILIIKEFKRK